MHPLVVAITGASGAIYAIRLLQTLLHAGQTVHLTISESGKALLEQELGLGVDLHKFQASDLWKSSPNASHERLLAEVCGADRAKIDDARLIYHHHQNFFAPIASGSFLTSGMIVCPCSGAALSAIAHAAGENLVHRSADVHLKERRRLVLVPRETPLSIPQLENMHKVSIAGATILPASPGWYQGVSTMRDLVDFVVARICDQVGVEHKLSSRWGVNEATPLT